LPPRGRPRSCKVMLRHSGDREKRGERKVRGKHKEEENLGFDRKKKKDANAARLHGRRHDHCWSSASPSLYEKGSQTTCPTEKIKEMEKRKRKAK